MRSPQKTEELSKPPPDKAHPRETIRPPLQMNQHLGFLVPSVVDTARTPFTGTPGFPSRRGAIGAFPRTNNRNLPLGGSPSNHSPFPPVLSSGASPSPPLPPPAPHRQSGGGAPAAGGTAAAAAPAPGRSGVNPFAALVAKIQSLERRLETAEGGNGGQEAMLGTVLLPSRLLVGKGVSEAVVKEEGEAIAEAKAERAVPLPPGTKLSLFYPMVEEKQGGGVFMRAKAVHRVTGQPTSGWTCVYHPVGKRRIIGDFEPQSGSA